MRNSNLKVLNTIAQAIYDKKGFNILALDVYGLSTLTDYYVIAEGNINRHVRALAFAIKDKLREEGLEPFHMEGEQTGDWLVMDYGDIIIHLFVPEIREKYALEELWKEAKIVDVKIVVKKEDYD